MLQIGIIGHSQPSEEIYNLALKLGKVVGQNFSENQISILCGGKTGVMEAFCKGIKQVNPKILTVGILPSADKSEANPYIDIKLSTGIGFARNYIIVNSSDLLIAIGYGYGTLSEIAFALRINKPIYGIKTWDILKNRFEKIEDVVDIINLHLGRSG